MKVQGLTDCASPPLKWRLVRYRDWAAMLLTRRLLPMSIEKSASRERPSIGLTSTTGVCRELTENAVSCVSRLRFLGSSPLSP